MKPSRRSSGMASSNRGIEMATGRQRGATLVDLQPDATANAYPNMPLPNQARAHEQSLCGASISIAVDPVALVTTECITVTSAMRKHARWAHSSVSMILGGGPSMARDISQLPRQTGQRQQRRSTNGGVEEDDTLANRWGLRGKKGKSMQDQPLLSAFTRLRNDLRGCTGRRPSIFCYTWQANTKQISEPLTSPPSSTLSSKSYALPQLLPQSPLSQSSP